MKRKRHMPMMGAAFLLVLALVAFFFLRLSRHQPPAVELPAQEQGERDNEIVAPSDQESLRRVEVTPRTVQLVIERLSRPENYRRTVTIQRFWSGTSALTTASVSVADGWTRVDQTNTYGETRHSITSPEASWIWYNESHSVYRGAAPFTSDEEQSIPTYENILRLDAEQITVADYRALNALNCIYVETAPDEAGYVDCYYIEVDSGLLASMERTKDGATAYLMSALSAECDVVRADAFTLPDGTALYDPHLNDESEGA